MFKKFTASKPKPRQSPVAPLQESRATPAKEAGQAEAQKPSEKPKELGGPSGPEPTRYGDWERKGICVDF